MLPIPLDDSRQRDDIFHLCHIVPIVDINEIASISSVTEHKYFIFKCSQVEDSVAERRLMQNFQTNRLLS